MKRKNVLGVSDHPYNPFKFVKNGFPKQKTISKHLIEVIKSLYIQTAPLISYHRDEDTWPIYVNPGVGQDFCLSPTLLNLYIDDLVEMWKLKACR